MDSSWQEAAKSKQRGKSSKPTFRAQGEDHSGRSCIFLGVEPLMVWGGAVIGRCRDPEEFLLELGRCDAGLLGRMARASNVKGACWKEL